MMCCITKTLIKTLKCRFQRLKDKSKKEKKLQSLTYIMWHMEYIYSYQLHSIRFLYIHICIYIYTAYVQYSCLSLLILLKGDSNVTQCVLGWGGGVYKQKHTNHHKKAHNTYLGTVWKSPWHCQSIAIWVMGPSQSYPQTLYSRPQTSTLHWQLQSLGIEGEKWRQR